MIRFRLLFLFFMILLLSYQRSYGQLCTGSLGDPVVNITFGSGPNPGAPLGPGITNMQYISTDCPNDGQYTIINTTNGCFGNAWYNLSEDHTPGDSKGYFMLINASFSPSDFYVQKVTGLCSNTTYEFAAWMMNLINYTNSILPDITFSIEKEDGTILSTINTGPVSVKSTATWEQYGFFFTTPPGINTVVIRMRNNAPGGNGNDIAIDDITFRPCGPKVEAKIGAGGSKTTVCEGPVSNVNLNASISTGYTQPVYQWQESINGSSWTDISSANTASYIASVSTKGIYRYRLAVAETGNLGVTNCRINSNEVEIQVNPAPKITRPTPPEVCEGSPLKISFAVEYFTNSLNSTWTQPSASTSNQYVEFNGSNNTGNSILEIANASLSDNGKYIVQAQNNFGCSAKDSVTVIVKNKPVVDFTATTVLCEQTDIQLKATANVGGANTISNYQWILSDGTASTDEVTRKYPVAASYFESVFVTASNGCKSDTVTKSLTVHSKPTVNFGMPEVCLADPFAQFTDSTSVIGSASLNYSWNFGDPNATSANPNISNQKDPRHSYTAVGNYSVQLTVTTDKGCINDSLKVFTVNGSVPNSAFTIQQPTNFCSANDVVIKDASSVNFGSITRVEIYWDYANDPSVKLVDEEPFNGKEYRFNYDNRITTDGQNIRIRYVAFSGINCVSESEQNIMMYKSPAVQLNAINPVCEDFQPFLIGGASELNGVQGDGVFSGPATSEEGVFEPQVAGDGVHRILYTFTTLNGCVDTAAQFLRVFPQPAVNAGPDREMILGGVITLQATANGNGLQYAWDPSTGVDAPNSLVVKVSPSSDITYTLRVRSADGCENSDKVNVIVKEFLVIPNAFTPNGDGKNDTWRIPYLESIPGFELKVFNRYGQVVFQSRGNAVNWDGTMNGKALDTGTYIYTLDRKNFGPPIHGVVHLIR